MRIIITETQLKKVLLYETKQEVITDEFLDKAKSMVTKLQNRGFTIDAACAMAGNIWAESQFDSSIESSNGALGLLQWLGDRKKGLLSYAKHKESEWSSEKIQLDYIKIELLDGYKMTNGKQVPNLPSDIKSSDQYEVNQFNSAMKPDTIPQKAQKFAKLVERCGDCGGTIDIRKQSAKRIHDYINGTYKKTNGNVKSTTSATTKKEEKGSHSVGSTVYPKESEGYANVRKDANRESDRVAKIMSPNKIGTITKIKTDDDGYQWYQVTLDKKVDGFTTGWVRSDAIK
jgi:hypothetical protein